MLITLAYSVLTWIQSRQRTEVATWVDGCCVKERGTLVMVKDRVAFVPSTEYESCCNNSSVSTGVSRSESAYSFGESPSRALSPSSSVAPSPRRLSCGHSSASSKTVNAFNPKGDWTGSTRQLSETCYNHHEVTKTRLLWEEDHTRALVVFPRLIVELHDWTAFLGTKIWNPLRDPLDPEKLQFYILLEAEPGLIHQQHYRKFSQFGKITAWKCGSELRLILLSDPEQLIELMHIFRLGQIILEGGWRVYRLTIVNCEGSVGTLISKTDALISSKSTLTPVDLRRLAAGIYNRDHQIRTSTPNTPKNCMSHDTSKHDITTINEETLEEADNDTLRRLPNWYERSPKKRSIATIPVSEIKHLQRRRVGSFCSGSLSSLSNKSSSLASLLLCSKSMSVDEEDGEYPHETKRKPSTLITSGRQSYDSLCTPTERTPSRLQSPMTSKMKSLSAQCSPKKGTLGVCRKSPIRLGKPPNVLVLCENDKRREEIARVLKTMLSNDRYVIYDIRWDQLSVGGWSEQTALLVLSGKIPNAASIPILLQFLGDGGRLLAWCCESLPFGPGESASKLEDAASRKTIIYGTSKMVTHPLFVSEDLWGVTKDNQPPSGFQRVLETNDSEGYSRPLTVSVFGTLKETQQTAIVLLDGGALGGKAVLSQIQFEKCLDEESALALLSVILSQHLSIDCTRVKAPDYSYGHLLGDHKLIMEFLASTPATIQQEELTVEFIPKGLKGSLPSHLKFPIKHLECPKNFSTLEYFENLTTKYIGRLLIYTDVMTSTMQVFNGHPLKDGLVVVAGRQTAGKGRGKNVWLSPEGCACFSTQINVSLESQMGRRISLFQHIAALAVILAVPNHEEINLRVKWPNDIYAGDQKIGGILVTSRLEGKLAVINLGIGVNVTNAFPTVCINSVLSSLNPADVSSSTIINKKRPAFTIEKLVAGTLSQLEKLLESIETKPIDDILNLYTDNWVHSMNEEDTVKVETSGGHFVECYVSGIDEHGFLRVTNIESRNVLSVRPDGNSFDIANKLIAIKD